MRKLLVRWLIVALAIFIVPYIVPGISVDSFQAALIAALVLGIVNVVIRPVLVILSLPVEILTLGLFTFVINALMLSLAARFVAGFNIAGFWQAILGSIVISIVNSVLNWLIWG
ncbi:MAG: phage holin family protein [Firmicutes bacterium]|nr:phage holin family protein [Bacillota bacterium]